MSRNSLKDIARKYGMFSSAEEYRRQLRELLNPNIGEDREKKTGKSEKKPKKEKIYASQFNHKDGCPQAK